MGVLSKDSQGLPKRKNSRQYDHTRAKYYENLDIPLVERTIDDKVVLVDERLYKDEQNAINKSIAPQLLTHVERLEQLEKSQTGLTNKLYPSTEVNPIAHSMVLFAHGNELTKEMGTGWYANRELLAKTVGEYFDTAYKYNMNVSVNGLALYMGMTRRNMSNLLDKRKFEHADIMAQAYQIIQSTKEDLAEQGKINAQLYMFLAQNYFGLENRKDIGLLNANKDEGLTAEEEANIINALPDIIENEKAY